MKDMREREDNKQANTRLILFCVVDDPIKLDLLYQKKKQKD
jgi:hypothetical protein